MNKIETSRIFYPINVILLWITWLLFLFTTYIYYKRFINIFINVILPRIITLWNFLFDLYLLLSPNRDSDKHFLTCILHPFYLKVPNARSIMQTLINNCINQYTTALTGRCNAIIRWVTSRQTQLVTRLLCNSVRSSQETTGIGKLHSGKQVRSDKLELLFWGTVTYVVKSIKYLGTVIFGWTFKFVVKCSSISIYF